MARNKAKNAAKAKQKRKQKKQRMRKPPMILINEAVEFASPEVVEFMPEQKLKEVVTPLSKARHCDEYIHDLRQPDCLRLFLLVQRMPAVDRLLLNKHGMNPTLFADFEGKRVRVNMASRLGDVGITEILTIDAGYERRVAVENLSNFSDKAR